MWLWQGQAMVTLTILLLAVIFYLLTRFVMKELFAALKAGLVEEVKRVFKETDISPTVCDEV